MSVDPKSVSLWPPLFSTSEVHFSLHFPNHLKVPPFSNPPPPPKKKNPLFLVNVFITKTFYLAYAAPLFFSDWDYINLVFFCCLFCNCLCCMQVSIYPAVKAPVEFSTQVGFSSDSPLLMLDSTFFLYIYIFFFFTLLELSNCNYEDVLNFPLHWYKEIWG